MFVLLSRYTCAIKKKIVNKFIEKSNLKYWASVSMEKLSLMWKTGKIESILKSSNS